MRGLAASRVQAVAQRVLEAVWVGVLPALLSALALRYLVPEWGVGARGVIAAVGRSAPMAFGASLFLALSLAARAGRLRLRGGRYATRLPAHLVPEERDPDRLAAWSRAAALHDTLVGRTMRRRLMDLGPSTAGTVEREVARLRAAIEAGDGPAAEHASSVLRSIARAPLQEGARRGALGGLVVVAAAVVAALGLRRWVAAPYRVLSASMLPTLEPDDLVLGRKLGRGLLQPRRGDVVVFRGEEASTLARESGGGAAPLVKRVVGVPGDRIAMRAGAPVINGWPIPTCDAGEYVHVLPDGVRAIHGRLMVEFLGDSAYLTVHSLGAPFPDEYIVRTGEVFVLGDNRGSSMDSRSYGRGHGGGVSLEAIEAVVSRFLAGSHRSGEVDLGRLLRPVDGLALQVRIEGVDVTSNQDGIARCLSNRPGATTPPSAGTP